MHERWSLSHRKMCFRYKKWVTITCVNFDLHFQPKYKLIYSELFFFHVMCRMLKMKNTLLSIVNDMLSYILSERLGRGSEFLSTFHCIVINNRAKDLLVICNGIKSFYLDMRRVSESPFSPCSLCWKCS